MNIQRNGSRSRVDPESRMKPGAKPNPAVKTLSNHSPLWKYKCAAAGRADHTERRGSSRGDEAPPRLAGRLRRFHRWPSSIANSAVRPTTSKWRALKWPGNLTMASISKL